MTRRACGDGWMTPTPVPAPALAASLIGRMLEALVIARHAFLGQKSDGPLHMAGRRPTLAAASKLAAPPSTAASRRSTYGSTTRDLLRAWRLTLPARTAQVAELDACLKCARHQLSNSRSDIHTCWPPCRNSEALLGGRSAAAPLPRNVRGAAGHHLSLSPTHAVLPAAQLAVLHIERRGAARR